MPLSKEIEEAVAEGKNPDRVLKGYQNYPDEWKAQYNMLLMDGITCASCSHCIRCVTMFGQKEADTSCQFYPNRFHQKQNS